MIIDISLFFECSLSDFHDIFTYYCLTQAEGGERQRELDEVEVKFQDSLRTQGKVSDRDIRHMMQLHQDQMNEYESK